MFNLVAIIVYVFVVLLIYLVLRVRYIKKNNITKSDRPIFRELILMCLVSYGTALIVLLFFQNAGGFVGFIDKGFFNPIERIENGIGVNFVPFKSINDYLSMLNNPYIDNSQLVMRNILGNIFLFTPVSLAMITLWKRWGKILNIFLFSLLVPVGIEFIQLFIGRAVDIDDVILNFLGLMIGFLFGKLITVRFGFQR